MRRRRLLAGMICSTTIVGGTRAWLAHEQLAVVVTFSILRDLAAAIAGDEIEVTALVGANADTHSYQGKPLDIQRVSRARLLVSYPSGEGRG